MKRWMPSTETHPNWAAENRFYHHLQEGFDALADTYDDDAGSNLIGLRMRRILRRALIHAFRPGDFLFEIGSGTGIDALWLARQGIEVVATDISQAMLDQLILKARRQGLSELLQCRKLAAREIGSLKDEYGTDSFDGGFCHAGALNMEPQLDVIPAQIGTLIHRNSKFVCSVVNKTSLFEVLFYPLVLKPRKGYRRLGNVIPVPISRREPLNQYVVPARFYSSRDMVRLFGGGFEVESIQGMQILLPPANLVDYYAAARPVFRLIEYIEDRISSVRPMSSWGHHTLITFRRTR